MKTHGICHAQSARKHRKAGHLVQELGDGRRYHWQSRGTPQMFGRAIRPYQKELSDRIAKEGHRQMINGLKAAGVVVDEQHSFEDIERVHRAFPIEAIAKAFEVPVHMIHTPQRIELPVEGVGTVTIAVGDRYWPKRRNQHSKAYHVLGFMAETGDVMFCRDGDTTADSTAPRSFYGLIGKKVQP